MFDTLTLNNLRSNAVEFACDIAHDKGLTDQKEILQVAIDILTSRLWFAKDEANFIFDDMTGRSLGYNCESIANRLQEVQESVSSLSVQISHLCVLYSKQD
jgi:hypothetical protein